MNPLLFFILGALSPLSQSIREIDAILQSKELQTFSQNHPITRVEKKKYGYLIQTDKESLAVHIIYEKPKKLGPQPFHLEFFSP